jgi:hypothetical protein
MLTFESERPPPHHVQQVLLMAAEEKGEYFCKLYECLIITQGFGWVKQGGLDRLEANGKDCGRYGHESGQDK